MQYVNPFSFITTLINSVSDIYKDVIFPSSTYATIYFVSPERSTGHSLSLSAVSGLPQFLIRVFSSTVVAKLLSSSCEYLDTVSTSGMRLPHAATDNMTAKIITIDIVLMSLFIIALTLLYYPVIALEIPGVNKIEIDRHYLSILIPVDIIEDDNGV